MTVWQIIAIGFQIIGVMTVATTLATTVYICLPDKRVRKGRQDVNVPPEFRNVTPIRGNGKMTDAEFVAWCHELDRNGT